jgi:hypothetical protein
VSFFLLGLIVSSWIPRLRGPLDLRWDAGTYYVLGTALAQGKGYRLLNEPGEIAAIQYPPLLPALIAVHQWTLGTSDPLVVARGLRVSYFLMFAAFIASTYVIIRRTLAPVWAVCGTLIVGLNLFVIFLSDLCFAELPYGLLGTSFVLVNRSFSRRPRPVLEALLAMAAYLLRSVGIALLIAWIAESLIARRFRQTLWRVVVALVPIVAWHAYVSAVEVGFLHQPPAYRYQRAAYMFHNVSYTTNASLREPFRPEAGTASIVDIVKRAVDNAATLPRSLGQALSTKQDYLEGLMMEIKRTSWLGRLVPWKMIFVGLPALGCLALAGIPLLWVRGQRLIALYLITYLVGLCATPWPEQFLRYLMPMTPFLVLSMVQLPVIVANYAARAQRSRLNVVALAVPVLMTAPIGISACFTLAKVFGESHQLATQRDRAGTPVVYRLFFYDEAYQALDAGLDWVREHARPSDIVAVSMPHWAHLRTGLKTVMPPFEADTRQVLELLDGVPVTYLIVDDSGVNFTRIYTLPAIKAALDRWTLVHSIPKGRLEIYKRTGSSTR